MAKIYSFEEAKYRKRNLEAYVALPLIENVPDDIQEALQIDAAERLRRTMKIANVVIESADIPPSRELTNDEQPPKFESSKS